MSGARIRIELPLHLRTLAGIDGPVEIELTGAPTLGAALDALEARHPVLEGTMRAHGAGPRRPFVRFFACERDLSHEPMTAPLPAAVVAGREPLLVVGAMAGG